MLILEMSIRPGRLDIAHQENRQRLESGEAIHNPSSYQLFGMDLSNAHSPGIISVGVKLKFCCIVRSRLVLLLMLTDIFVPAGRSRYPRGI
jgi:hypothetical protein